MVLNNLLIVFVSIIFVLGVVWLSYKKKNTYLLSIFILPVIIYLLVNQINGFFNLSWFLFVISIISVIVFPLTLLSKKIDKNVGLLLFLSLLIIWDWAVTWVYVHKYAIEEMNTLLNINNFYVFSLQKLFPVVLFGIMYYVAKNERKLLSKLDIGLGVVAVAYYGVFSWQLWVISMMDKAIFLLLSLAFISGLYTVFVLLKRRFSVKSSI